MKNTDFETPYKVTDNFIFVLTQPKHVSKTFSISLKAVPTNIMDEKTTQAAITSCNNLFLGNFTQESALTPKRGPGRKKIDEHVSNDDQSILDIIMGVEYIYPDNIQPTEDNVRKISKQDVLRNISFKFIKLKITEDDAIFVTDFEGCLASGFKEKKKRVRRQSNLTTSMLNKKK